MTHSPRRHKAHSASTGRRGITVITHDGIVLPSIQAARAHYGGVSYPTIMRYADQETPTQLRIREDPRDGVRGVRCVLPNGTTERSLSALARKLGCTPTALYHHIERHEGHTVFFRSLPTKGRTRNDV